MLANLIFIFQSVLWQLNKNIDKCKNVYIESNKKQFDEFYVLK